MKAAPPLSSVTPAGESLLIDTGNPVADDRDAKRIYAATQQAGLKKIDYLLTTHYHGDHVGGAPALAKMIPIEKFLDHGQSVETQNARGAQPWEAYLKIAEGRRTIVKPGDKFPLKGVDVLVVSSNGEVLAKPITGGGPNPACQGARRNPRIKQRISAASASFSRMGNSSSWTWVISPGTRKWSWRARSTGSGR